MKTLSKHINLCMSGHRVGPIYLVQALCATGDVHVNFSYGLTFIFKRALLFLSCDDRCCDLRFM